MKAWDYAKGLVLFVLFGYPFTGWTFRRFAKILLVLALTAGLMTQDQRINDYVHQSLGLSGKNVLWLERGLNGRALTAYLATAYAVGYWLKNPPLMRVAMFAAQAFALSGAASQVFKFVFGRHRPRTLDSPDTWTGFETGHFGNKSFPSAHTTVAFAVAVVLFAEVRYKWVGGAALVLAVLMGVTRVVKNQHWTSDVFFGGALGIYIARRVLEYNSCRENPEMKSRVS